MKIISYKVHNVMRISDMELEMDGANLVLVGGKNGHGKSSALKALLMALCGKRDMDWPDIALKDGETEGWVTVNLSGDDELQEYDRITVELLLRKKRGGVVAEEFRVLDSTGEEAPEPRALLRRLYEFRAFDPLDFERAKPKDRAELLRKLVGLDFSELDEKRKAIYAERTVVNTAGKNLKAIAEDIEFPEDTPDEAPSARELFEDLEAAQRHNRKVEAERISHRSIIEKVEQTQAEIDKYEARLKEASERLVSMQEALTKQFEAVKGLEEIDVSPIQERINTADSITANVAAKQKKAEIMSELEEMREKSKSCTKKLESIDATKQERLENAQWPLPGMSLDESGVLLDGLPFEQASKAQRVLSSVKVGMALNPKLRLLVCEDGNDLDNETLAALDKALKDNDFQMLLEFVTRNDEDEKRCAVVFHEGAPKNTDEELELAEAVASE